MRGVGTATTRGRDRIGRRLTRIQEELGELAQERSVLAEQLVFLRGVAADATTQAAVRPSRADRREAQAAGRDVANHERILDELDSRRAGLEQERDTLLDSLLDTEDDR